MSETPLAGVAAALELAELEADAHSHAGGFPLDLTRPPSPLKAASKVDFAAIDARLETAKVRVGRLTVPARTELLSVLTGYLELLADPGAVR